MSVCRENERGGGEEEKEEKEETSTRRRAAAEYSRLPRLSLLSSASYYTRTLSVSLSIAFSFPLPKSLDLLRVCFPLHQCPLLRPFRLACNSPPWALRRARSRYVCQAIHRCAGANWPTARRWSRLVRVHPNVTETTPVADISAL